MDAVSDITILDTKCNMRTAYEALAHSLYLAPCCQVIFFVF